MTTLLQRFQQEVKANGKKAGILAGLFLFGCCFWVPMLTKAVTARPRPIAPVPTTVPDSVTSPSVTAETPPAEFWAHVARSLDSHPAYQAADVRSLQRDPFQIAEDMEPLPVLFAEAPPAPAPKVEPVVAAAPQEDLFLQSTIISRQRRAALINGQLYHLGRRIQTNGRQYEVTRIESHRVELTSGESTIELTMSRRQLRDVLERGSPSPD